MRALNRCDVGFNPLQALEALRLRRERDAEEGLISPEDAAKQSTFEQDVNQTSAVVSEELEEEEEDVDVEDVEDIEDDQDGKEYTPDVGFAFADMFDYSPPQPQFGKKKKPEYLKGGTGSKKKSFPRT